MTDRDQPGLRPAVAKMIEALARAAARRNTALAKTVNSTTNKDDGARAPAE